MRDLDEIYFIGEMDRNIAQVNRKLAAIKRKIKPKVFQAIEFELFHSSCHGVEIVSHDGVNGKRMNASNYFGESVAVRHVYNNLSSCSYSETWGGELFIPIGLGRYVKLSVHG